MRQIDRTIEHRDADGGVAQRFRPEHVEPGYRCRGGLAGSRDYGGRVQHDGLSLAQSDLMYSISCRFAVSLISTPKLWPVFALPGNDVSTKVATPSVGMLIT